MVASLFLGCSWINSFILRPSPSWRNFLQIHNMTCLGFFYWIGWLSFRPSGTKWFLNKGVTDLPLPSIAAPRWPGGWNTILKGSWEKAKKNFPGVTWDHRGQEKVEGRGFLCNSLILLFRCCQGGHLRDLKSNFRLLANRRTERELLLGRWLKHTRSIFLFFWGDV